MLATSLVLAACGDEEPTDPSNPPANDGGALAAPDATLGTPGSDAGGGGNVTPPADGATPQPTSDGGTPAADSGAPVEQSDDCEESFELRAYGATPNEEFSVPLENDHYECFYFKADRPVDQLATSLSPLLDETSVLHHWLLFASDEEERPSGTHSLCDGIHPQSYLMASWLPGTPALILPKDVGMDMPSGPTAQFILENHYNNSARHQGLADKSGVRVCATNKPKKDHAAIHWLGGEQISLRPNAMGTVQATCTPSGNQPIHILGVIPHMHKLGRHVTMTILRANGTTEPLHDAPFEFENQAFFPKSAVLMPGDRVTTKCDYMNTTGQTVTLGESTSNEMCYMFTVAYPAGLMNTGGDLINPLTGQAYIQGDNRCMR